VRRLGPLAAVALVACALLAMAAFLLARWRATSAAADRDLASSLVSDAARSPSPPERAELLRKAHLHYEDALRANPLDDSLRMEYGNLLMSLLVPPDPSGRVRPDERMPGDPELRVRIDSPDGVRRFRRAAELYGRAAELNRSWAGPHVRLGGLFWAAAAEGAGALAREALQPFADAYAAQEGKPAPGPLHLPALREFGAAQALDPNNPSLLLLVAEAHEALGDLDAAVNYAERAGVLAKLLYDAQPGHKLCLTAKQVARVQRIIQLKHPGEGRPAP